MSGDYYLEPWQAANIDRVLAEERGPAASPHVNGDSDVPPLSAYEGDAGLELMPDSPVNSVPANRERNGTEFPPLLTLAEMLALAEKEPGWFLDGILPGGGLSLLCGDPKTGKSSLSRCLALASATGQEFMRRPVARGCPVMVSLEDPLRKVAAHMTDMQARPDDPVLWATRALIDDMTVDQRLDALRHWIGEHNAPLAVIDPLQDFLQIGDLNDYAEVSRTLNRVMAIARDTGAHVLLIHHSKKSDGEDGKAALGSQALFGKPDTILTLRRDESDGLRYLSTRQREGEDLEPVNVTLDPTGWIQVGETRAEQANREADDAVLACINGEWTSRSAIAESAGMQRKKALAAIDRLAARGLIEMRGDGTRGKAKEYRSQTFPPPFRGGNGGTEFCLPEFGTQRRLTMPLTIELPTVDRRPNEECVLIVLVDMETSACRLCWTDPDLPMLHRHEIGEAILAERYDA